MPYQSPQPRTVLVVEDHDNERQVIVRGLREEGYRVIEAIDGELALSILASGLRIDLLVTDIAMPNMGGMELATVLKAIRHPPILLFMSAYDFEPSRVPGRLLRKPFRPSELVAEVRRLLAVA
jgi:two-component system, cell cycle sensor histidine kinase and response regulator CckA